MFKPALSCTRSILPIFLGLPVFIALYGATSAAPSHTSLASAEPATALGERQFGRAVLPAAILGQKTKLQDDDDDHSESPKEPPAILGQKNKHQDDDGDPSESPKEPPADDLLESDEEQRPKPQHRKKPKIPEAPNSKPCPVDRKCLHECCDLGKVCAATHGQPNSTEGVWSCQLPTRF